MSSFFRRRQGNTPNNNGRSTESSDRTSDSNNTNDTRSSSLSSSSQARRSRNDRSKETRKSQGSTTFRVRIPQTVRPGEMFQVYAGTRLVKLKCPPNATPGQSLAIKVPKEEENSADARNRQNKLHGPNVDPIPNTNPPAFMVTIPPHVRGGQQFPVKINGVDLMVTSPHNALPGMSVRIVPPKTKRRIRAPENNKGQLFEVQVPKGVQPGKSFALLANGIRISVTCPLNASPGQSVRFHLPFRTTSDDGPASNFVVKTLNYDLDGWVRTLQVSIMKFQWIRVRKNSNDMDKDNIAQDSVKKQISQLAYVTQISTTDGLECVSAQHGMVDIFVLSPQTGKVIATCTDLVAIQSQNFSDKLTSFYDLCGKVGNHGKNAHKICIQVRRDFLLEDSLEAVMSLNGIELKNIWRFHFMGEEGVDAGGLKREWFQLISSMLLDPESGLWMNCGGNQMNLQINPNSAISCDDDLLMFRFLGRVLGKAVFDRQLIAGHLVQYLYKHLLGWPITFTDLEHLDPIFYRSLQTLMEMDDVEFACLDFTTSEEMLGAVNHVALIPDGENVDVTQENLVEYLEAVVQYRLIKRVKNQMKELLMGFTEVIPEALLTIFDFQELELVMCGLPHIDVDDWMANTRYSGAYNQASYMHPICVWFWEVVKDMSEELRAKLLQFVTGTSGVPAKGFSVLQGNDGNIRLFHIHSISLSSCIYPRAHTCFNRIDLPLYESKSDLKEKLTFAITMLATGFDME